MRRICNVALIDTSAVIYPVIYRFRHLDAEMVRWMKYDLFKRLHNTIEKIYARYGVGVFILAWDSGSDPARKNITFDDLDIKNKPAETYRGGRKARTAIPDYVWAEVSAFKKMMHTDRLVGRCGMWSFAGENAVEADDIIYDVLRKMRERRNPERHFFIVSNDKDFFQLVSEDTSFLRMKDGGFLLYTPEQVQEEFCVEPIDFPLWQGIVGDKADNIPGINGIGSTTLKKALRVVSIHQLFELQEHEDKYVAKILAKLRDEDTREAVQRSVDLARFRTPTNEYYKTSPDKDAFGLSETMLYYALRDALVPGGVYASEEVDDFLHDAAVFYTDLKRQIKRR